MWADEVLEKVRSVREAQAARFGFDVRAIVEDMQRREGEGGRRVAQPPDSPVAIQSTSNETLPRTNPVAASGA
ncbi:MAG: hypothetical protein ACRDD1_10640 [Planctomycetia bacterium]